MQLNEIGRFYKPWFYKHVESYLNSGRRSIEYIPLRDYYHRHTKGMFWNMEDIVPFGNSPFFRYTLGWAMPPKVSFLKLTQGETLRRMYEKYQFVQDMLVPAETMKPTIEFIDNVVKVENLIQYLLIKLV